jgi:two-component system, NtrC family, sensor kinase
VARTPSRAVVWLRLLLGGSIVIPASFVALNSWQTRHAAIRETDLELTATTRLLSEEVRKVLETNQLAIALVDHILGTMSWDEIAKSDTLRQQLRDLDDSLPQVVSIVVMNPNDEVASSSHKDRWPSGLAPANYYWMRALHDSPDMVVTPVYTGKVTHEVQFSVGLRRSSPNGHFNGAIVVSDRGEYFEQIFAEVAHRHSFIALALTNGSILATRSAATMLPVDIIERIPDKAPLLATGLASPLNGRASLRRVEGFPLVIAYAFDDGMVFDLWFHDVLFNVLLAVLVSSCTALTCFIALRSYARENEAHAKLHVEMGLRRDAEAKMYQSQRMEALGQLTSGVAHDFNNMLTVVIGNAEQIVLGGAPRPKADAILNAAQRSTSLVSQMLSFARRQILRAQPYDVCHGLHEFTPMIRTSIKPSVALDMHVQTPLVCFIDPGEFELAVLHVVRNADMAMPDGGQLAIRCEMVYRDGDADLRAGRYGRLSFADTGKGMPDDVRQRVFEPFFTTRDLTEGVGLGLSQVYGFVKQSGGDVFIESELDRGTKLVMYLPMDEPRNPDKTLILVVDDERDILNVVDSLLGDHGYEVHCTDDPMDAVQYVQSHKVALLLTDIVMPRMSGFELAQQVTAICPQIKVLIMTGFSHSSGAYPLLRKPFRLADLLMRVRTALGEAQGRWTQ